MDVTIGWYSQRLSSPSWITGEWTGYDSSAVAMVPVAIFSATGIFDKDDLARIDWAVLWMVAGGFHLVRHANVQDWAPCSSAQFRFLHGQYG